MIELKTFSLSRLNAKRHVAFHRAVRQMIENLSPQSLTIPQADIDAYSDHLDAEQDWVNVAYGSDYTPRMQGYDQTRKGVAQDILSRLYYAQFSTDATVTAAFPSLQSQILSRYKGLSSVDYSQRSALIGGLLMDLGKQNPAVLKALGVDALMETLEDVNSKFERTFLSRNAQRAAVTVGLPEAREALDADYATIMAFLVGVANLSDAYVAGIEAPDERERIAARRDLTRRAVREASELIAYYRAQYLTPGASKAGASEVPDEELDTDADADTPPGAEPDSKPSGPTDVTEVFD